MAALIVQRPSPESDTRPENLESAESSLSTVAIRSSSQEAKQPEGHKESAPECIRVVAQPAPRRQLLQYPSVATAKDKIAGLECGDSAEAASQVLRIRDRRLCGTGP
jgi:hypothetical protein